ncbi:hypothetical protein BJ170DRAFT_192566 [Xylariales sp. AK1849]|nr:hypothetical protein BJ170DRAFT_192566 [Xylariales sp. AK1849]
MINSAAIMAPPPSTPAPHRFLVPKRSATQRSDHPKPLQGGAHQFQATPRFSLLSTSREPAQSSSSTPVRSAAFVRQRHADSIGDVIDSSPPIPQPSHRLNDSIEVGSSPQLSTFPSSDNNLQVNESDDDNETPSPKRRRLSVSSDVDTESPVSFVDEGLMVDDEEPLETFCSDEVDQLEMIGPESPKVTSAQQPTFHKAPRFKPVDHPEGSHYEPLPDVFSPHRRGAMHVPGGLAAELRDWLMDVEAGTGPKREGEFIAKIIVDEVRNGSGMILVKGRNGPNTPSQGPGELKHGMKIILAGEGRLHDLARKKEVVVGSLIGIIKPVWEVDLEIGGKWAVACDWEML